MIYYAQFKEEVANKVMLRKGVTMNATPTVSIITPTYNRGNLLQRCYDSLVIQTSKDFEWIIVDDGSLDNTREMVSRFDSDFDIIYIIKKNGGKHTALNASHPYIHGKCVLILDSDDYLISDAIKKVIKAWNEYGSIETIGIVTFLKGESVDKPFCYGKYERIPVDIMRGKRICMQSNDCCEIVRSDLFKKYPFPVYKGEKYFPEGVLWNKVSFTHKCVYINEVVYIAEYLDGGLTKSGRRLRVRNPRGGMYSARINMHRKNRWRSRLKNGVLYNCYCFFVGVSPYKIVKKNPYKVLTILCMIPGWIVHLYWKEKYLKEEN